MLLRDGCGEILPFYKGRWIYGAFGKVSSLGTWPFPSELGGSLKPLNRQLDYSTLSSHFFE